MVQRFHTSTAGGHEFVCGAAKKSHQKARVEDDIVDIIKLNDIIFNSHLVKQSL